MFGVGKVVGIDINYMTNQSDSANSCQRHQWLNNDLVGIDSSIKQVHPVATHNPYAEFQVLSSFLGPTSEKHGLYLKVGSAAPSDGCDVNRRETRYVW